MDEEKIKLRSLELLEQAIDEGEKELSGKNKLDVLGKLISKYVKSVGHDVITITVSALKESNFNDFASELEEYFFKAFSF